MKIRLCEACGFRWESETDYGPDEPTKCPKCEAKVRGDSLVKTVRK